MFRHSRVVLLACFLCAIGAAQQPSTSVANVSTASSLPTGAVPHLVKFSGALTDAHGQPLQGRVSVTFSLYENQSGGTAVWVEHQNVSTDANGRYSALLGSYQDLPMAEFAAGRALWIGVTVDGGQESARQLFLSVPYALTAENAQTLGGKPASAYVSADQVQQMLALSSATAVQVASGPRALSKSAATNQGNANGNGKVVNNSNVAHLDRSNVYSNPGYVLPQVLGSVSDATAAQGANSNPLDFTASAFSNGAAQSQVFRLEAEPAGNNSAGAAANLNVLFGANGAAPVETGLWIGSNGLINFAVGQTFPGTISITLLQQEAAARAAADAQLQNAIDAEVAARTAFDSTMSANLASETARAQAAENSLSAGLAAESAARQSADSALQAGVSGTAANLTAETNARVAADNNLQTAINGAAKQASSNFFQSPGKVIPQTLGPVQDSSSAAGSNSNPLVFAASSYNSGAGAQMQMFQLQAEPSGNNSTSPSAQLSFLFAPAGSAPMETGLSIASNGVITFAAGQMFPGVISQSALDGETAARQAGDSNLQASLNAEVSARQAGDASLQTGLSNETSARQAGDASLQSSLSNETSARQAGDASLQSSLNSLQSTVSALQGNLSSLQSGLGTLQTNVNNEISTVNSLQSSVSSLQSGLSTVQTNLNNEVSARQSAVSTLQSNLNSLQTTVSGMQTNVSSLQASVANLQTGLTNEVNTRYTADQNLKTAIHYREMVWSPSVNGILAPRAYAAWTPAASILITRIEAVAGTAAAGSCSTLPTVRLSSSSGNVDVAFAVGSTYADSHVLSTSLKVSWGDFLQISGRPGSGCSAQPSDINVTVEYVMYDPS